MYLSQLCRVENKVVPMSELRITKDALVDRDGVQIDVLYRQTYPIEDLIEDQDPETGDLVGVELLQLVKSGKLFIINPLSSFLLQPKSIQCLIWGLVEEEAFYTNEERQWIKEYMLPTYLEPDLFLGKGSFVQNLHLVERDTITIRDKDENIMLQNTHQTYKASLPIFQKYTELPVVLLETEKGMENLSYVFGSF